MFIAYFLQQGLKEKFYVKIPTNHKKMNSLV